MNIGLFTFDTNNLGDEMQSLAVLAHVDRVRTFIDRDHLADFHDENKTACVFNSFFMLGDDFRLPAPAIKPLWYGFRPGRHELFEKEWLAYMKQQPPIGCRDLYSLQELTKIGVDAYWSGCLTLFLGTVLPKPAGKREGIYFIDLPVAAEAFLPPSIVQKASRLSTFPCTDMRYSPLERWAAVARLTNILATAELVLTRRLHVALPAASFGTPVVAIPDPAISVARERFTGFDEIIPTVFLDKFELEAKKIDWQNVEPARISDSLKGHYAALCKQLHSLNLPPAISTKKTLEDFSCLTQRLINIEKIRGPGFLRLKLNDRVFALSTRAWNDEYIDVGIKGFLGLSKFDFEIEVSKGEAGPWVSWGFLRDLVMEKRT